MYISVYGSNKRSINFWWCIPKVKKGEVQRAIIVRTKKPLIREDGTSIKFDTNAAVLLDKQNEPIGTRIFGPVTRELRKKNMMKIVSLAPEVL